MPDVYVPYQIPISPNSEFFIAIAKQGVHSFLFLGMAEEDSLSLLARVGKTMYIDKDFDSNCTMTLKTMKNHSHSFLGDEGLARQKDHQANISYQAYSITLAQYRQFLRMISTIQAHQQVHYSKMTSQLNPEGLEAMKKDIACYVPNDEGTCLTYQTVSANELENSDSTLSQGLVKLSTANTCRTSAKSMLTETLASPVDIADFFALNLDYHTQLVAGTPQKDNFYILPPPPNSYPDSLSLAQKKMLAVIYKKLESVPKHFPGTMETNAKFATLKKSYLLIAGTNRLELKGLLEAIKSHRQQEGVCAHRGNRLSKFFQRFFKQKTSTEKIYAKLEGTIANAQNSFKDC